MLFNSISFLLFFPIAAIGYFLFPQKIRYVWLLLCSYYFYMSWNPKYALLILFSTCITFISGIAIDGISTNIKYSESNKTRFKKIVVLISIVLNLSILFYFKYFNFVSDNINNIFSRIGLNITSPSIDVLLPVGISFYTFQALGYTIDVYRGDIKSEKNILKYALFVSFFPQLVAGPIERSKNLLTQLNKNHYLKYENLKIGILWMLWGYFIKLGIADRIAIIVDSVYGNPDTYQGLYIITATFLFAFQVYCDFNGYTMIARGVAKIMDYDLMENFNAPYLSSSVAEFWRNWHISLSSWFKDYLYIPLGGNRKGRTRKQLNILIVFFLSGVWHGASWGYIIWGTLNGVYQILGDIVSPLRVRLSGILHLSPKSIVIRFFKVLATFILIDFSWLFFRARTISQSISLLKNTFYFNYKDFSAGIFNFGISQNEFYYLFLLLCILFITDLCKYKQINLTEKIMQLKFPIKCIIYTLLFWIVVLTGIYGVDYDASSFIYFQF